MTETLYLGDVIRVVNVDSGVQYYVEEDEKAGYAANPEITYKEAYGTKTPVDSTKTKDGYYIVSGNTASSATVINKFLDEKAKVEFEKTWYDADGNVLSGKTLPGSITIELFKKGADANVVSTGKTKPVSSETNWKGSFTDLPKYDNGVEIVYSIKESAIEGAEYEEIDGVDGKEGYYFEFGPEEDGQRAVVGRWKVMALEDFILQNTWTPATETASGHTSFNIVKIDKNTKEPLSGATFELKLGDDTTFTATTNADGEATFDNLGAGEYTLKETDAPDDYKLISAEANVNIEIAGRKLKTVNINQLENTYEYVFSLSASQASGYQYNAETRTFTVENEPIPYDDISASKVWDDDNDRDGLRQNYANYYVAVKNNSGKYVAYKKLALKNQDYTFEHLPTKTINGDDITYEIIEASTCSGSDESIKCTEFKGDKNYTVTIKNGTITNFHEPALYNKTGELTVQKLWDGEGNDLARPNTITIELYGEITNDDGEKETWMEDSETISSANEWKWTFKDLYVYKNGKEITYSVQESKLDNTAFGENESTIVVYASDNAIAGSWTKSVDNEKYEVTNTWKKSTDEIVYEGAKKFNIKKVDENYKPMAGVTFAIEGADDRQTDAEGMTSKSVPVSKTKKEDSFEFVVSEKATLDGYDLVEGSATVAISCTSELKGIDTNTLVNTYVKTCEFTKSGSDKYVWDAEDLTLTVVNKRSLAKSLTIKKTVKGLSAEVLADLEFTVKGPEDFGENSMMTLKVSEDCTITDDVITCRVEGKVPTGKYTVTESNADVEHFELIVSGDNDVEKKVAKDEHAVFEITNEYEVEKTMYYVDKIWEDAHDKDGKRPDKLTINLLANGEVVETVDLTMKDAYIIDEEDADYVTGDIWGYVWEGLPYADKQAEVISYTVEEVLKSDDYEQLADYSDEYWTTFVNYHEPEDDPCAEGGCGGDIVPPMTPETGKFTGKRGGGKDATVENLLAMGGAIVMAMFIGMPMLAVAASRRKK